MLKIILSILTLLQADMGEVDLLTRQSVMNHFRDYGQEAEENSLQISSSSMTEVRGGNVLLVNSSIKAYSNQEKDWYIYRCTTSILIGPQKSLSDGGTNCYLDAE